MKANLAISWVECHWRVLKDALCDSDYVVEENYKIVFFEEMQVYKTLNYSLNCFG